MAELFKKMSCGVDYSEKWYFSIWVIKSGIFTIMPELMKLVGNGCGYVCEKVRRDNIIAKERRRDFYGP